MRAAIAFAIGIRNAMQAEQKRREKREKEESKLRLLPWFFMRTSPSHKHQRSDAAAACECLFCILLDYITPMQIF
jgi:hypothetical protein